MALTVLSCVKGFWGVQGFSPWQGSLRSLFWSQPAATWKMRSPMVYRIPEKKCISDTKCNKLSEVWYAVLYCDYLDLYFKKCDAGIRGSYYTTDLQRPWDGREDRDRGHSGSVAWIYGCDHLWTDRVVHYGNPAFDPDIPDAGTQDRKDRWKKYRGEI